MRRPEYLSLHARAHHPERVREYVAYQATDASRYRVQLEGVLMPAILLLEIQFRLLIQGEVYGVKEGDAEHRYGITYIALLFSK